MFILSKKYGRLCNRLFNTAHILALAIEHQQCFVNLSFYEYAEHFESTQGDLLCRYPVRPGRKQNRALSWLLYGLAYNFSYLLHYLSRIGIRTGWLGLHLVRAKKGTITRLDTADYPVDFSNRSQLFLFQGWDLRCFDLIEKHGTAVREYFRPKGRYEATIQAFMRERRVGVDLVVAVVIRHGDYRKYLGGKYFFPLEAYLGWMKQVRDLFEGQRVSFLVFSDEEQDTALFAAAQLDFYFRSGHMIENLYSMAECDYILTPPSTYGMWASFYGKKPLCVVEDATLVLTRDSFKVCKG